MTSAVLYFIIPLGPSPMNVYPDEVPNTDTIFTNNSSSLYNTNKINFSGYCLDTGTTRSLIGFPQFNAHCQQYNLFIRPRPSTHSFRFGTGFHQSQATLNAPIPLPNQSYIYLKPSIVRIDVPYLIGLDFLLEHAMKNNFHKNLIQSKDNSW